ncbi:MAG: hypothetical protein ABSF65_01985 [Candidatus Bathyarchaeia archaeon]|jgi:hypothetical protein
MSKQSTISVSPETLSTWNELSTRTGIPISTLIKEIAESVQKQLDLMQTNRKLLFMSDFYNKDNVPKTIIRLSDYNSFGFDQIPQEYRKIVLDAFGYSTDGKFTDLREKKESEKQ